MDFLTTPLQFLRGVGPKRAADLERAGLLTVEDLLLRFPRRYEDRATLVPIAQLRQGQTATVVGQVLSSGVRSTRRPGFRLFELVIRDDSGPVRAIFPNQTFLKDVFKPKQQVVLHGPLEWRQGLQLSNPDYEILGDEGEEPEAGIHMGRIVPVHEKVGSVTPRMQRALVHRLLADLPSTIDDPLPPEVAQGLVERREAIVHVHFPPSGANLDTMARCESAAHRRLIFEEFFLFQAGLFRRRAAREAIHKAKPIVIDARVRDAARDVLPFKLTPGQRQATKDIVTDMQSARPMNRLLQGDVGAGKTMVAILAAVVAMENGLQVAVMAPTEILAEQHYATLRRVLDRTRFRVALLTGSLATRVRRATLAELESGVVQLVVGTHALAEERVVFAQLGLVVIDEQHRFGVLQRAMLRSKGGQPDVLVMTATPIPRTLALTTFGDLDISVIRDRPPGRQAIRTLVRSESRREEAYAIVRRAIEAGQQAYVVYPLVEGSEKVDMRAATEMADHLQADIFPEFRVALLHGRLPSDEKERVMAAFARGDVHVLVSTTVIEVGVDVPNATVMVIEHAERFGLSQLHQLRGRVGRGAHASTCVLVYQHAIGDHARQRLDALAETDDGFVIAERDLEIRGPGDFFGTRQSGLPTLRVGDLMRDHRIMEDARLAAERYFVVHPDGGTLAAFLGDRWATRFGLAGVG